MKSSQNFLKFIFIISNKTFKSPNNKGFLDIFLSTQIGYFHFSHYLQLIYLSTPNLSLPNTFAFKYIFLLKLVYLDSSGKIIFNWFNVLKLTKWAQKLQI